MPIAVIDVAHLMIELPEDEVKAFLLLPVEEPSLLVKGRLQFLSRFFIGPPLDVELAVNLVVIVLQVLSFPLLQNPLLFDELKDVPRLVQFPCLDVGPGQP